MGSQLSWVRSRRLSGRLAHWFLLVAVAPLALALPVIYQQRSAAIEAEAVERLVTVRDLKVGQLNSWLDERIGEVRAIATDYEVRDLEGVEPDSAGIDDVSQLFQRYVERQGSFHEIYVVDPRTGIALASSHISTVGESRPLPAHADAAHTSGDVLIGEVRQNEVGATTLDLSLPVHCRAHPQRHLIAVVVAEIDHLALYGLLLDRTGMGQTGETLIVNRHAVAISPLRWQDNAPFRVSISAEPARLAALGQAGVTETPDYRGVPVLAAYAHLPRLGWGFVAKQDLVELHAPAQAMLRQLLYILIASLVLVSLIAILLARSIAGPLAELTEAARKIEAGDLTARYETTRSDEIGVLATALRSMTTSLQGRIEVQRRASRIAQETAAASSLSDFADRVVRSLVETTAADFAAFHLLSETGRFEVISSLGLAAEAMSSFDAARPEGLQGAAVEAGQVTWHSDIPDDTVFVVRSIAGDAIPRQLVTVPLAVHEEVVALVSLGSVAGFSATAREVVERAWLGLSAAAATAVAQEEARRLAEQLQDRNLELGASNVQLAERAKRLSAQAAELQELADELESQREHVEEATRLKSEFLSNMSHELRTPLNSILALSQLMLAGRDGQRSAKDLEYLAVIERSGRQLLHLINDILDLSRIEAGKADLNVTGFSAREPVTVALETIRPLAQDKGLELSVEIPDDLELKSDRFRVGQILLNLLSNAVKFTQHGSVRVVVAANANEVEYRVRDTGIGIARENLAGIFDEFRQVDGSATRRYEGTGLGLAIGSRMARLLGGRISVQSTPGVGSTFTLHLPLASAGGTSDTGHQLAPARARTRFALTAAQRADPPLILVVDDGADARLTVAALLEQLGLRLAIAVDGQEGVDRARELEPDLILMDMQLPVLSGADATGALKADPVLGRIPLIAVTARAMSGDREEFLALGCDDYVSKPIEPLLLEAALARWLPSDEPVESEE